MTWPAGRIQREYPILLDPPGYSQKAQPPSVAAAPASRVPDNSPATAPASSSSTPAPAPSGTAPGGGPSAQAELGTPPATASVAPRETAASGDTYGPIQKGETLRKIAEETKPSNVSLEQMLVALYRENKGAFVNNNMNRLKTGQILRVPSADEVAQVEAKDANKEIRTHVADWNSYREQLGGSVAAIPARSDSTNAAAGRVSTAAVTPPAPASSGSSDVLKLSKSETGGKSGASKGGGGNQDRVNALQEEVTAKDKALKEAQSRVTDLEKQIRDMQRLLDLKGSAPTKADTKVATAPPPEPAKVEPVKPPEPAKVEPVKPADTKVAEASPRKSRSRRRSPTPHPRRRRSHRPRRPRLRRRRASPTSCSTTPGT